MLGAITEGRLEPGSTVNPATVGPSVGAALYALSAAGPVEATRAGFIAVAGGGWARWLRALA